ncbi:SNF1-interacting protein [Rhodotorula kratochvilovae]
MGNSQSSSHGGSRHSGGSASGSGPVSGLRSRASTLTGGSSSSAARAHQDEPRVVDGGWTDPQSLLYARLEYHRPTVHKLIADRKLAPFYLGLQDFEDDWPVDRIVDAFAEAEQQATQNLRDAHAAAIEAAAEAEAAQLSAPTGTRKHKEAVAAYNAAVLHRERLAETLKAREKRGGGGLQLASKSDTARLYQGHALECPICFLYYPPNMVHTRCCDQPICTECFVQIKRADPTPTHLESEPAACPFCMEPNFGCIYEKPVRPPYQPTASGASGVSESSVAGTAATPKPRRKSFAHTEKEVVTTDMIHPDWEAKLEAMKATVARRANRRIVFRQVGDRLIPVGISSGRGTSDGANPTMATTTLPPNFLSQIAAALDAANETGAGSGRRRGSRSSRRSRGNEDVVALLESLGLGGGPDLEEMMVQEAMRLSQLEEEERLKKTQEEEAAKARAVAGAPGAAAPQTESSAPPTPRTTERLLSEAMLDDSAPTGAPPLAPAAALRSTAPTPTTTAAPPASSPTPSPPVAAAPPAPVLDVDIPSTPIEVSTSPIAAGGPSTSSADAPAASGLGHPLDPSTSRTSSLIPPPTPSPSQGYQPLGEESDHDTSGDAPSDKHAPSTHVENGGVDRIVGV